MRKGKVGRNDPCPCESGKKYKFCHGRLEVDATNINWDTRHPTIDNLPPQFKKLIAEEKLRNELYGSVKRPVTVEFQGHRMVAVGNRLLFSKKWKTFHDFLFDYIKGILGTEWGNSELKKPLEKRHPILKWYHSLCDFQRKHIKNEGEIYQATCTGAVGAYLSLAYDLYILRHHSLLQNRLIARLKHIDQFQGARYEIYVTASFIRAGFDLEFEDETDPLTSHCEFNACYQPTGGKYSIEAKSRHRSGLLGQSGDVPIYNEIKLQIDGLLYKALKKYANNIRIVFLDINMPPRPGIPFNKDWFPELCMSFSSIEISHIKGAPSPPAYIFITNHPYHYVGEEDVEPQRDFVFTAINMPAFKIPNVDVAMGQDPGIFKLWESINKHTTIPHEFS